MARTFPNHRSPQDFRRRPGRSRHGAFNQSPGISMTATHAFMLSDLRQSLIALLLFPLFVVAPGFVLAWLTDLLRFRRRTAPFQLAVSIPLSISICPIAIYLAGRFGSMRIVWGEFAAVWLIGAGILIQLRQRAVPLSGSVRRFAMIAGIWTSVALFALIDLQWGRELYFSTIVLDYSVRTQFIHSITATGIPPANPFFYPGHFVPIRYHYFWLLVCSLVEQAGGRWIGPRAAWIAGAIWCGIGLIALVALYLRIIWYRGPASYLRRAVLGAALLGVTGLDILPNAGLWILYAAGMPHAIQASGDWWNEQVAGFTSTALWEAHYLCGLICCLTAFLVLWGVREETSLLRRAVYGTVAGLALGSAAGSAIYIAFVFGAFLALWTVLAMARRAWRETGALICAGVVAILVFIPYAHDLRGPASGGPPLQFWVRPFSPIDALLRGPGQSRSVAVNLLNAAMLPLNYFLELGIFFVAGIRWWRERRRSSKQLQPAELAIALMVATSILICTFVRSSVIGNNDLGWRGFLIA